MKNWNHKNFTIHQFEELESTNSYAFAKAELREISDKEIISAQSQSSGKGRKDRNWDSPKGNLYFSLVLTPNLTIEKLPQLSFIGILALKNAVEKSFPEIAKSISLKWPNDLLIDKKKVSGILLESKISNQNPEFVILGIGINLISNPENVIFKATNLKNYRIEISPEEMLKKFLDEFDSLYENYLNFGFRNIQKLWIKSAYKLNEEISIKLDEEKITGIFENLDEEGNLLLKTDQKTITISAADIL